MRIMSIVLFTVIGAATIATAQVRPFDLKTTASLGRKLYERSDTRRTRCPHSLLQQSKQLLQHFRGSTGPSTAT